MMKASPLTASTSTKQNKYRSALLSSRLILLDRTNLVSANYGISRLLAVIALPLSFWFGMLWQSSYQSFVQSSICNCNCNFREVVFRPHEPSCDCETESSAAWFPSQTTSESVRNVETSLAKSIFPTEFESVVAAMARTSKQDFMNVFDLGVPINHPPPVVSHMNRSVDDYDLEHDDNILILYGSKKAMPNRFSSPSQDDNVIPSFRAAEAVENCQTMNVVMTQNDKKNQCVILVPQYENYHIQKWMRIDTRTSRWNPNAPLRLVPSTHRPNGQIDFTPPDLQTDTNVFWSILYQYLSNVETVLNELRPLLQSIVDPVKHRSTVIIMVCNFGQSELLLNFVCSARRRHLDLANLLVFATDSETAELVTALGITVYYDHRVRVAFMYCVDFAIISTRSHNGSLSFKFFFL
jgi:hypothetical protein